jgi:hypothetical protein
MLIAFLGGKLSGIYNEYNYKQSSTIIVIEQAFGRLEGIGEYCIVLYGILIEN